MYCSVFSYSTYGTWVTSVSTTLLKSTETWVTGGEVEFSLWLLPAYLSVGIPTLSPCVYSSLPSSTLRSESGPTWAHEIALGGGLHSRTFKIYHLGFLNCFVLFSSGRGSGDKDQMHSWLNHTKQTKMAEWSNLTLIQSLVNCWEIPRRGACGEEPGTEEHKQVRSWQKKGLRTPLACHHDVTRKPLTKERLHWLTP